ncbi:MAG: RdgB/HAM1 family non-canonical purine NTP pyrophosphatase [Acidimicrobiales bacterium]|nr:RdgB/HAM1 family non-canonical purine NTP pyrophosphatase [Acidimicrobiales bacterium]
MPASPEAADPADPGRGGEEVVLASANPKKAAEIVAIVGDTIRLVPRPDTVPEVVEDADTFLGNARLKARALVAATGLAALADDSGLEVDALAGAPGVRSARYAGEDATDEQNVERLLAELAGNPDAGARRARFRCVLVLARPDGTELVVDGTAEGSIALAPRGANGFGYDPVFVPDDGDGSTFAEMDPQAKHDISHRGRALRALAVELESS